MYNKDGNVTSVTSVQANGSTVTETYEYDTSHPDRLIKYNNTNISYNNIGCPINYNGYNLVWKNGKLTGVDYGTLSSGRHNYTYAYNAQGQRISKNYSKSGGMFNSGGSLTNGLQSSTTDYFYDSFGRLICETRKDTYSIYSQTEIKITYLYDEGSMIGMSYNEDGNITNYYFQRNLQGDVIAIYNSNGAKVVEYRYDAYGNCTIASSTTDYALATVNPIRYRGYYFDQETGLYFLNARYYSPEWRRFISPDDSAYLDPESVNGLNLYCYCGNDPVNYADPSGHVVIAALIFGGAIGFALGFGFSIAGQYAASNGDWNKVNLLMAAYDGLWGAVNGVLATTNITLPLAILAGATMGGISSIGSDLIFNNGNINWDGVIINTVLGGVASLIAGSGSGVTIDKYVHSKDILNRTIANGTTRAIGRQASVMYKHMLPLVDSGIRYIFGNGFGTMTSKGITVT